MAGPNGNQPHAAISKSDRLAQRLEATRLRLIGNHNQADIGGFGRVVDQLGQVTLFCLANVDYRFPPRCRAAQLKCESGLAHSRLPLDVQMKDAVGIAFGLKVDLRPCHRQVGPEFRRCLIAYAVFVAALPSVNCPRARGCAGQPGRDGGMLVAPLG